MIRYLLQLLQSLVVMKKVLIYNVKINKCGFVNEVVQKKIMKSLWIYITWCTGALTVGGINEIVYFCHSEKVGKVDYDWRELFYISS
jgi:hypothetical protein